LWSGPLRQGMPRWRDRVAELLYDGESVRETVELDGGGVVVTSHRVLAFRPEMDGANFRGIDRPNVDGISTGAVTEAGLLERAIRFGVIGGVLVVAGTVIDFGSILGDVNLDTRAAGQVGVGGILGPLQGLLDTLRNLDVLMQAVGALVLLLAVVLGGVYWYLREPTLVVEIAGGDDVHLPRPAGDDDAADRLRRAVAPGATTDDRSGTDAETRTAGDLLGES